VLGAIAVCSSGGGAAVGQTASPAGGREVRIALRVVPPFVIATPDGYTGYSIDVWEDAADNAGVTTTFVEVATPAEQLAAVTDGRADVGVGALTITEAREETVDFTVPMFDGGLDVLSHRSGGDPTRQDPIRAFFSSTILVAFAILLLATLVAGLVMWLIERHENDDFDHNHHGWLDGIWWAIVTLVTVGYGDRVPQSRAGRSIAVAWMLFGLIFIAMFTATITSTLTVRSIEQTARGVDDLAGAEVVTVPDTVSADALDERGIAWEPVTDIDAGVAAVADRRADAFVYDEPILRYRLRGRESSTLTLAGATFQPGYYGFAVREGDDLVESVDQSILTLQAQGTLDVYEQEWFGAR